MVYAPQITTEEDVRAFFQPRLSEDEYSSRNLLAKIKATEYFVNKKYGVTLSNSDEAVVQAVIMLVASKVGSEPRVIQRRLNLTRESWVTEKQASEGSDPYSITKGWACDAKDILRSYLPDVRQWKVVNK